MSSDPHLKRLPLGIDFGAEGGVALLKDNSVIYASKTPTFGFKYIVCEIDDERDRSSASKLKADRAKKRYSRSKELKPKSMTIYDTAEIENMLRTSEHLARQAGYAGIVVAIEEPQMHIGKSHPKTYFASGRGQNAWFFACNKLKIRPVVVNPKTWKSDLGLDSEKQNSVVLANACMTMPEELSQDHDVCEAALIAFYIQNYAVRYLR
jgi:hypothetical protein